MQEMLTFRLVLIRLSKTHCYYIGRLCFIVVALRGLHFVESLNVFGRIHHDIIHVRSGVVAAEPSCCVDEWGITQYQKVLKSPISPDTANTAMSMATSTPFIHLEDLNRNKLQVCGDVASSFST